MAAREVVDLRDIPDLLGLGPGSALVRLKRAALIARGFMVEEAKRRLHSTERDYVNAIAEAEFSRKGGRLIARITVEGEIPYMVEHGMPVTDLRTTILKPGTKRLKRSARGYFYAHIPFRHMNAGATGRNAPAIGSQHAERAREETRAFRGSMEAEAARKMGRAAWRKASKLAPTVQTDGPVDREGEGPPMAWGGRLEEGLTPRLRGRHAIDLTAGMVRIRYNYPAATQSAMMTFRTISENPASVRSDADAGAHERNWMHPGITARRIIPAAADRLIDSLKGTEADVA